MTSSLADLIAKNPNLSLTENNRIKCSITNHELAPQAVTVLAYLNGPKFKKAKEWYTFDYSEFLPHIVEDKKNPRKLFCKLSRQPLNKIPHEVTKHVNGKKFKRLLEEYLVKKNKKISQNDDDDEELDIWVRKSSLLHLDLSAS